jgi:hypothetical protein
VHIKAPPHKNSNLAGQHSKGYAVLLFSPAERIPRMNAARQAFPKLGIKFSKNFSFISIFFTNERFPIFYAILFTV